MNLVKLKDIQRKQPAFWNVGIIIEILRAPFISAYVILECRENNLHFGM